jgi:hypothetical protein
MSVVDHLARAAENDPFLAVRAPVVVSFRNRAL